MAGAPRRGAATVETDEVSGSYAHLRALGMLLIGVGYLALVGTIGYVPAVALLVVATRAVPGAGPGRPGSRSWRSRLALFYYLIFVRLLGIPLPPGIWPGVWRGLRGLAGIRRARPTPIENAAMEMFAHAWTALTTTPAAFAAMGGVVWGIIGGALPGISPSITMALLLPFTYGMEPLTAIVLLASTYVGAEYGGSIPAVLIRTPGTNAAAATVIDGYAMQQQGRGGEALGISLISGVTGGLIGLIVLVALTEPLAQVALLFTPMAYFALGILAISVIATLAEGMLIKGLITGVLGLMIAMVGTDPQSGVSRFTFGRPELLGGIEYILVMVGVFAVSELLVQAGAARLAEAEGRHAGEAAELRDLAPAVAAAGDRLGDRRLRGLHAGRRRLGRGVHELQRGEALVAAPRGVRQGVGGRHRGARGGEQYRRLHGAGADADLRHSGLELDRGAARRPADPRAAAGPLLFEREPEFIYGLYGGLAVANVMQIPLGILIMTPCLWLVSRPKPYLLAGIYALIFSGVYSINHSLLDLWIVLAAGVLGYGLRYFGFPFLPLVLGLILGHMIEIELSEVAGAVRRRPRDLPAGPGLGRVAAAAVLLVLASLARNWYAAQKQRRALQEQPRWRRLRLRRRRNGTDMVAGRAVAEVFAGWASGLEREAIPRGGARSRKSRCSTSPACASPPGTRTTSAPRSPPGTPRAGAPRWVTPAASMPPARR